MQSEICHLQKKTDEKTKRQILDKGKLLKVFLLEMDLVISSVMSFHSSDKQ